MTQMLVLAWRYPLGRRAQRHAESFAWQENGRRVIEVYRQVLRIADTVDREDGCSTESTEPKRQRMREVFFDFEPAKLVRYGPRRMDKWLQDAGIIRHRGKLEAMLTNAQAFAELADFSEFIWGFVDGRPVRNRFRRMEQIPATTPQSTAMAKSLKRHGFRFVGPTTCYAFMQSAGLVNDHLTSCPAHRRCEELG